VFQTNIVYFDSGTLLGGDWSNDRCVIDGNLYFDARPGTKLGAFRLGPCPWTQWKERGHDSASAIADPLFVAPGKNDFRLQSESPALKMGFQGIDLGRVGP